MWCTSAEGHDSRPNHLAGMAQQTPPLAMHSNHQLTATGQYGVSPDAHLAPQQERYAHRLGMLTRPSSGGVLPVAIALQAHVDGR